MAENAVGCHWRGRQWRIWWSDASAIAVRFHNSTLPYKPYTVVEWLYIRLWFNHYKIYSVDKMIRHIHYDIISSFAFGNPRMIPSWGTESTEVYRVPLALSIGSKSLQTGSFRPTVNLCLNYFARWAVPKKMNLTIFFFKLINTHSLVVN